MFLVHRHLGRPLGVPPFLFLRHYHGARLHLVPRHRHGIVLVRARRDHRLAQLWVLSHRWTEDPLILALVRSRQKYSRPNQRLRMRHLDRKVHRLHGVPVHSYRVSPTLGGYVVVDPVLLQGQFLRGGA